MDKKTKSLLTLAALATALLLSYFVSEPPPATQPVNGSAGLSKGDDAITTAFRERRSDVWVETQGTVIKILSDDNEGSRHQRFILRLGSNHTVLVAHNIDLAPRIDELKVGDTVNLRGEYEWNERGGVIHWTHHDPQGRHEGGWIRHEGETYQ